MKTFVGCCGFPVNKKEYFKNFGVVEIQQTFYQPPEKVETIKKWREEASSNFEYTLKAWQLITHLPTSPTYRKLKITIPENTKKNYGYFKPTDEVFSTWNKIDKIASILNSKIIIFQCPASFLPSKQNKDNIKKFFNKIQRKNYIFVWEPRGEWTDKDILHICKELDLVHCVDLFKNKPLYGKIRYYRLHGRTGYNYKYTNKDLGYLMKVIDTNKGLDTYVMFNNTNMYKDALKFNVRRSQRQKHFGEGGFKKLLT